MRLSLIQISNFRNFEALDLELAVNTVVVGENKIGETNLLHAIRLVLDPSLPDSARQLKDEDSWDGLPRPLSREHKITVSLDLIDFEHDENQVALLCEHLIEPDPHGCHSTTEAGRQLSEHRRLRLERSAGYEACGLGQVQWTSTSFLTVFQTNLDTSARP